MHTDDTIVAISSPAGAGWRGIVRLSGPQAWALALGLVEARADAGSLRAGAPQCLAATLRDPPLPAWLLLFAEPKSFTGQDVAELHVPGSLALLQRLTQMALHAGARQAEPGEFSARAFFNGKIDLTEAEGIAATIAARSDLELRAASALREGRLHQDIASMTDRVATLLALIEAGIDFSDEPGVSFISAGQAAEALRELGRHVDHLLATAVRVDRLDAPPTVVLIGKPNVGKSSLVNALTGRERSIVSPVAGTTRDVLAATLHTPAGDIRLLDVPGEEIPTGEMETRMMDARRLALLEADLVIRVIDPAQSPAGAMDGATEIPAELLVIQNKTDLLPPGQIREELWLAGTGEPWGQVSAKTGHNIPRLRELIAQRAGRRGTLSADQMVLNQRHRLILRDVKTVLWDAAGTAREDRIFQHSPELLAADLRHALDLLGQVTGAISPDEVLGRIFSSFCIGK